MPDRRLDEEEIFHVARKIPDPEARAKYLDQICSGDQRLSERVEALLQVHDQEQAFLQSARVDPPPTAEAASLAERPGATIGRYRLMEQIGEGGMGIVYVAEQEKPLRRKVALKVIKPGMDSKAVTARFEAERQALAMMDHANIAKVFDAGTTEAGHPYFVMELVRGVPITEYCDQNKLTIRERLELFSQVCQAIQHAHQKGIIHRDIKPSNVLVTLHDDTPVPKVIDFGVAKALNARLTDRTIYTEHLQVIGTLLYMSPEQAQLSGLDIDTRSDIYSLGVLLYELLTGTTPFQKEDLDQAGFDEQRRIIREQEPPRASIRISSLRETATAIAEHRRTDAHKLHQQIRGDLDWIVLKALEKDRTRRYESAASFSADIGRYLRDEAVVACPPSATYRFTKIARRNRVQMIAAALIALSLLAGTVVSMWMAYEAGRERDRARALLAKLQGEIIDRALVAAFGGDLTEAKSAIADACDVQADPSFVETLQGLASLFGGREQEAVNRFETAVNGSPGDPRAWALLFCAYRHIGDLDGYSRAEATLQRLAPASHNLNVYERLFLGYAESETHVAIADGVAKLRSVVKDRPSWGIARAMLAQSLANLGDDTRTPQYLDQAIHELSIAKSLLPENPFVLAVGLHVHTAAVVHGQENGLPTDALVVDARNYADLLESHHRDYLFGRITRARYFCALNRPVEALAEWQSALACGGRSMVTSCMLGLMARLGRLEDIHKQSLGSGWAYALAGDRSNTLESCAHAAVNESMLNRLWRDYLRRLCGDEKSAMDDWHILKCTADAIPKWVDNPLRLFTKELSSEVLLQQAQESGSRFWKGHTYFCVAADHLARGEREEAARYLDLCIQANCWGVDFHQFAIALQDKLRQDPAWPNVLSGTPEL